jgi:glucose-1-phosphate adenylyltransferase
MSSCCVTHEDPNSGHDLRRDVLPYCARHHRLYFQDFEDSRVGDQDKPAYWRDVNTLDAYWAANMDLVQVTPHLNLYDNEWPIWTWQPQSPPAKFVHDDPLRCGVALDSMVAGGCIVSGATVRRSMLFADVRIHSNMLGRGLDDSGQCPDWHGCTLKRCIIDKNCNIPDGTMIGLDPVEDARRFHVTQGGVTLVTRVMLGQEMSLL